MWDAAGKIQSAALSAELWRNLRGDTNEPWELIYFIANAREINLPFSTFAPLVGYEPDYLPQGFSRVRDERLQTFFAHYDDVYSVLLRLKGGDRVQELPEPAALKEPKPRRDEEVPILPPADASDHLRMQWLLLKNGTPGGAECGHLATINNGSCRNLILLNLEIRLLQG